MFLVVAISKVVTITKHKENHFIWNSDAESSTVAEDPRGDSLQHEEEYDRRESLSRNTKEQ